MEATRKKICGDNDRRLGNLKDLQSLSEAMALLSGKGSGR